MPAALTMLPHARCHTHQRHCTTYGSPHDAAARQMSHTPTPLYGSPHDAAARQMSHTPTPLYHVRQMSHTPTPLYHVRQRDATSIVVDL